MIGIYLVHSHILTMGLETHFCNKIGKRKKNGLFYSAQFQSLHPIQLSAQNQSLLSFSFHSGQVSLLLSTSETSFSLGLALVLTFLGKPLFFLLEIIFSMEFHMRNTLAGGLYCVSSFNP